MNDKKKTATRYRYQAQKFSEACRALMLPLLEGHEDAAFGRAFDHCRHGLRDLEEKGLDDNTARLVAAVRAAVGRKPEDVSREERIDFASHVHELAIYFEQEWARSGA